MTAPDPALMVKYCDQVLPDVLTRAWAASSVLSVLSYLVAMCSAGR